MKGDQLKYHPQFEERSESRIAAGSKDFALIAWFELMLFRSNRCCTIADRDDIHPTASTFHLCILSAGDAVSVRELRPSAMGCDLRWIQHSHCSSESAVIAYCGGRGFSVSA